LYAVVKTFLKLKFSNAFPFIFPHMCLPILSL
jgi:hypothetical protein